MYHLVSVRLPLSSCIILFQASYDTGQWHKSLENKHSLKFPWHLICIPNIYTRMMSQMSSNHLNMSVSSGLLNISKQQNDHRVFNFPQKPLVQQPPPPTANIKYNFYRFPFSWPSFLLNNSQIPKDCPKTGR